MYIYLQYLLKSCFFTFHLQHFDENFYILGTVLENCVQIKKQP